MRFLRTAPTGRLLAVIATVVVVIAAGTAIAMAATGGGPVPARQGLAQAVHQALAAPPVKGISADISFSDNLIDSSDFTGQTADPLLQGATGRLWIADDGRIRLELQSGDGDAQVVVDHGSFWISDPTQNVVYKGTLPARHDAGATSEAGHGVPTVSRIQSFLTRLMQRVDVSGAQPTDVAGRAAYRVTISPQHDGGLLGSAQIAWDAANGVPLQLGIYARGNPTPVIDLKATHISYGTVPASDLNVSPPAGAKIVQLASPRTHVAGTTPGSRVQGAAAVAAKVPFTLDAPKSLVGLPLRATRLVRAGGDPEAMLAYGEHLGGMIVFESKASAGQPSPSGGSTQTGGLSLPTVTIGGATGTELSTPLGTVIHFTRGGVDYTVLGSVPATAAEMAARGL